jgi:hypothetical protein
LFGFFFVFGFVFGSLGIRKTSQKGKSAATEEVEHSKGK